VRRVSLKTIIVVLSVSQARTGDQL